MKKRQITPDHNNRYFSSGFTLEKSTPHLKHSPQPLFGFMVRYTIRAT